MASSLSSNVNSTLQLTDDRYFRSKNSNSVTLNKVTENMHPVKNLSGSKRPDKTTIELIDAHDNSMDIFATGDLRHRNMFDQEDADYKLKEFSGTIHPFTKTRPSFLKRFKYEFGAILQESQARKISFFLVVNFLITCILLFWCQYTDSMALTAYTYLTIFDMMSLITCLITIWVNRQKPSPIFSFGYERFEVLAVFSSTTLAQFGSFFIFKESTERLLQQPDVHTGRLLLGGAVGFLFHMIVTYAVNNKAFDHVISAASSNWLQEHFADISRSMCSVVPGLDKLLLPRVNPLALIGFAGGLSVFATHLLIEINNYFIADTLAAIIIAFMTCGTMFPMSVYTGKMLLQTTPSYIIGQLDKCLREASTLDGVLEFRNEHFWTLSFGRLAGSLHVRIRRDANEQMVLAHVTNRLSNLVSILTIQVFKDDWNRPTTSTFTGGSSISSSSLPLPKYTAALPKANPTGLYNSYTPSVNLTQHLSNIGLPQTPSRAASTPYGTPVTNKNVSFHTDIEPIPQLAQYSGNALPYNSALSNHIRLPNVTKPSAMYTASNAYTGSPLVHVPHKTRDGR